MTTGRETAHPIGGRQRAARKLVLALAIAPAIASLAIEAPVPAGTRGLITLLWVLCLLPAYSYFGTSPSRRRPLPFLPAVSLMYGLYYALPVTLGATDRYYNAPIDPRSDYDLAAQLAFFGWVAMMVAYAAGGVMMRERPLKPAPPWRPEMLASSGLAILFGIIFITAFRSYLGATLLSGGAFQFLVSLQWFAAGLLTALARRGELSRAARLFSALGIGIAALNTLATGSLAPLVMLLAVVSFGAWIGKPSVQKRWVISGVLVLLVATSFRGVAADFRKQVWFGNAQLSQTERVGVMYRLLISRIQERGLVGTVGDGIAATAGRSANLDLFANVIRRTPSEVPYWNGTTYLSLAGSFVPRFMWPTKPTKELGQAFGHRYRLLHWTNTSTAINLPILVEFFANFSTVGVIIGMLVVGLIYRFLDSMINRAGQTPLHSMIGAVLLLPLLLIESDFSLTMGGLPLNAAAFTVVWWALGRLPTAAEKAARGEQRFGRVIPIVETLPDHKRQRLASVRALLSDRVEPSK